MFMFCLKPALNEYFYIEFLHWLFISSCCYKAYSRSQKCFFYANRIRIIWSPHGRSWLTQTVSSQHSLHSLDLAASAAVCVVLHTQTGLVSSTGDTVFLYWRKNTALPWNISVPPWKLFVRLECFASCDQNILFHYNLYSLKQAVREGTQVYILF